MKIFKIVFLLFLVNTTVIIGQDATVTPAPDGTDLTATDNPSGWAEPGDIIINEIVKTNILVNQTDVTLILSAPTNWRFNAGVGSANSTGSGSSDITFLGINIVAETITLTFTSDGNANRIDEITISGIQVQPIDPGITPSLGDILRTAGTSTITGIDGTDNFGTLSLDLSDPLPVELSSFSASVTKTGVLLNWKTETEVNNYGFEVQRSIVADKWEVLGFVEGHGNSNSPKEYIFIDREVNSAGTYLYRLKQIDNDGSYEFSKTIEVNFGSPIKFDLSQNYPNPFNPSTTISFNLPKSGIATLKVYNLMGEEIITLVEGYREAGIYTINFNAEGHPSGMYLYRLSTNGFTETKKMLFMK